MNSEELKVLPVPDFRLPLAEELLQHFLEVYSDEQRDELRKAVTVFLGRDPRPRPDCDDWEREQWEEGERLLLKDFGRVERLSRTFTEYDADAPDSRGTEVVYEWDRPPEKPWGKVSVDELLRYHEAGHAVACHAVGLPFSRVCTIADGDCAGYVQLTFPAERVTREGFVYMTPEESNVLARCQLFVTLAGRIAERLGSGTDLEERFPHRNCPESDMNDRGVTLQLACFLLGEADRMKNNSVPSEKCSAYVERVKPRVEKLLRERWRAVDQLQTELLYTPVLSGEKAVSIIEGALKLDKKEILEDAKAPLAMPS